MVDCKVYESQPPSEKWRLHRTFPAAELLSIWTNRYASLVDMLGPNVYRTPETGTFHTRFNRREGDEKARETGPFEPWQPDVEKIVANIEDPAMRRWRAVNEHHTAVGRRAVSRSLRAHSNDPSLLNVYDSFLRYGWPDAFDKDACRSHLIELEDNMAAEEKALLDANNPDAGFFDD